MLGEWGILLFQTSPLTEQTGQVKADAAEGRNRTARPAGPRSPPHLLRLWTAAGGSPVGGSHAQPGDRRRPQGPGIYSRPGPTEEPSDSDIDDKGTNG